MLWWILVSALPPRFAGYSVQRSDNLQCVKENKRKRKAGCTLAVATGTVWSDIHGTLQGSVVLAPDPHSGVLEPLKV